MKVKAKFRLSILYNLGTVKVSWYGLSSLGQWQDINTLVFFPDFNGIGCTEHQLTILTFMFQVCCQHSQTMMCWLMNAMQQGFLKAALLQKKSLSCC